MLYYKKSSTAAEIARHASSWKQRVLPLKCKTHRRILPSKSTMAQR